MRLQPSVYLIFSFIFIMTLQCFLVKFNESACQSVLFPGSVKRYFAGDCWQRNKRNITVTVPQICFYWFMMIGWKFKGKLSSKQNVVHAIHDLKRTSALLAKKTSIMLPMSSSTKRNLLKQSLFIYLSANWNSWLVIKQIEQAKTGFSWITGCTLNFYFAELLYNEFHVYKPMVSLYICI